MVAIGFFSIDELPKATLQGPALTIDNRASTCKTCGRYRACQSPQLKAIGKGEKKILVITGEVTRAEENSNNTEHSANYSFLKKHFKKNGINLENDCWYTHAIRCYYTGKSTSGMTKACHNKLIEEIRLLKPEHIVITDTIAWEVLLDDRLAGRAIHSSYYDWCCEVIPDQELQCWVHPIYDPAWVRENDEGYYNKLMLFWEESMKAVLDCPPFPTISIKEKVKTTKSMEEAISFLEIIDTWKYVAFDYETTGIKPYRKGHDIVSASFSNGNISYSFPVFTNKEFRKRFCETLQNASIKIAHNLTFERMWSEVILGTEVNRFKHDTQIMQHYNNNTKPTGLKFLSYARYGYLGYDNETDEYIRAETDEVQKYGANAFNNIKMAPMDKLLYYGAIDSLFTFWLYEDLNKELASKSKCLEGYKFFIEAEHALCKTTMTGMRIDTEEMAKQKAKLESILNPLYDDIMNHNLIIKQWDGGYRFNPKSDYDVRRVMYGLLKLEVIKRTDKGEPSVDEEALAYYKEKSDIIPMLLEYRRWHKALNTYIKQYETEQTDGTLHAFFGLNKVKTFRGSSGSPNLQNVPVRDKEVRDVIRCLLKPKRGHKLIEYDYKANEVGGAASISGDPELIRYVTDPTSDMHQDMSIELYMLESSKINKALRNNTKGPFVFATFYGSYWKQTAKGVWDGINISNPEKVFGIDVVKHLRSMGIKTYEDWEEHVKEQERILWEERFPVYQEWRKCTFDFFQKNGYVDYVNGFRYYGPATKNELLNAPVQGPSFHCQLWCYKETSKMLEKKEMESCLIGQVHDSILASVLPGEEDWMDKFIYENGTQRVKEFYPWIKVPLMIEKASTGIDEPWSMKKDAGYLHG